MTVQQDAAQARAAARALEQAVSRLAKHYPPGSADVRRLLTDTERLAVDIDLLAGPEPAATPPKLEVIPDGDYPAELFADADDEGLGPAKSR